MVKLFAIPIILSIALGIAFPYLAMTLMPAGFGFLMLLMVCAGLGIDWKGLPARLRAPKRAIEVLVGLVFLYGFFPLCQAALAAVLVPDRKYIYGIIFASLSPVGIVSPYFTRLVKGDEELSFLLLVVSTLLCPFIAPMLLTGVFGAGIQIDMLQLSLSMIFLVTVPLALAYSISRFLPSTRAKLVRHSGWINGLSLSGLIYILFGTAVGRLNLSYSSTTEIAVILALMFVQDFAVYFASQWLFPKFFTESTARALSVSLSMKNVAIAAGVLLFYDPKASFPAALAFVAHAFFFSYLAFVSRRSHPQRSCPQPSLGSGPCLAPARQQRKSQEPTN